MPSLLRRSLERGGQGGGQTYIGNMTTKNQYYLFIDECGDQNLSNFDKGFPIFTLCGIIVSEDRKKYLDDSIEELKREFWGEKKVILHSRDIRKCQN